MLKSGLTLGLKPTPAKTEFVIEVKNELLVNRVWNRS